jgi:citrate lyase beta subunit
MVDLERMGKAQRQPGGKFFLSSHRLEDVAAMKAVCGAAKLHVRINPVYDGTRAEVDDVVASGADIVMLPMVSSVEQVAGFVNAVHGRAKTSLLMETAAGLDLLPMILEQVQVDEVHVGLNDLALSLGRSNIFEALFEGRIDRAAAVARAAGVPFGFGGVASPHNLALPTPAELILSENVRLGAQIGLLGRSFRDRITGADSLRQEITAIRDCLAYWQAASREQLQRNRDLLAGAREPSAAK